MDPSIISEELNVQQPGESKYTRKREVDLSAFNYMRIHKLFQKLLNLSWHTRFTLSSTNKSINLQQWDPGMLSLICDAEDDTAIAVQR